MFRDDSKATFQVPSARAPADTTCMIQCPLPHCCNFCCPATGRVTVHPIEDAGREESEATFQVPQAGAPANITCMALSAHFLIAGTEDSKLLFYQCHNKALLNEFRHNGGAIIKLYPQLYGTRSATASSCLCFLLLLV